jgi:small subunit ribosomal protein S1
MSWTKKVSHPSAIVNKGDTVRAVVLSVDPDRKRVALGLKQLESDPWTETIPEKYHPSDIVTGTVTKLTNFGAFVEIEDDLEGLLHISEMADHKVEKPEEIVNVGDEVTVMIINIDTDERKIGLSLRATEGLAEGETPQLPPDVAEKAEAKGSGEATAADIARYAKTDDNLGHIPDVPAGPES